MKKEKNITKFLRTFLLLFLVAVLIGGVAVWKSGYTAYPWQKVQDDNKTDGGLENVVYDTWKPMSWQGVTEFHGKDVWTDGVNYYYSGGSGAQFVLDVKSHTWIKKEWKGFTSFRGRDIWTDGVNFYYSNYDEHYILDVENSTWYPIEWNDNASFSAKDVFVIEGKCYRGNCVSKYYKLSSFNRVWSEVDFSWLSKVTFYPHYLWSDGTNYWLNNGYGQYLLDFDNCSYVKKNVGLNVYMDGCYVWKMNDKIYYSCQDKHYVFDVDSQQWAPMVWNTLVVFDGDYIWSDGINHYYSNGIDQYVLVAY